MNIKKALISGVVAVSILAGTVPAFATGNSIPGLERYLSNPGHQQAVEVGAQCGSDEGSGIFGYLGKDANVAGGANGFETGLYNSGFCGNREGN